MQSLIGSFLSEGDASGPYDRTASKKLVSKPKHEQAFFYFFIFLYMHNEFWSCI